MMTTVKFNEGIIVVSYGHLLLAYDDDKLHAVFNAMMHIVKNESQKMLRSKLGDNLR
jgi:hypothetical protein